MKVRLAVIFVFLVALAAVAAMAWYRAQTAPETHVVPVLKPKVVRCEPLRERSYAMTESYYGLIQANARVEMAFQVAGRISQIGGSRGKVLRENDLVERGQVLAMLEPQRYEAALQQSLASLEQAKAALASAQAQTADYEAKLQDAQRELERLKQLQARNAANAREIERAEIAVKVASAHVDSGRAQVGAAAAQYEGARASEAMSRVNLQDATLKAPMRAVVAAVPVEIGQMVQAGQSVVSLVDMEKVKLVVGAVERKLPLLREGQKVKVEVQALAAQAKVLVEAASLARPREGVVTMVPPAADPVTGLFNVEIELDNSEQLLRPGMVAKATVTVLEKRAIAVPAEAVMRSGNRVQAFFVMDGYEVGLNLGRIGQAKLHVPTTVAKRVEFEPIAFDKDYYLVAAPPEGLTRLVVEGQNRLEDGQTVTVVEKVAVGEEE